MESFNHSIYYNYNVKAKTAKKPIKNKSLNYFRKFYNGFLNQFEKQTKFYIFHNTHNKCYTNTFSSKLIVLGQNETIEMKSVESKLSGLQEIYHTYLNIKFHDKHFYIHQQRLYTFFITYKKYEKYSLAQEKKGRIKVDVVNFFHGHFRFSTQFFSSLFGFCWFFIPLWSPFSAPVHMKFILCGITFIKKTIILSNPTF